MIQLSLVRRNVFVNNKKSMLKYKYAHNKKLSSLIPDYKVNPATIMDAVFWKFRTF